MFEDFYKSNFKDELSKEQYYELLEIVNDIVLNLPRIKEITKWQTYPYKEHKEKYEYLGKIYVECRDMKGFIDQVVINLYQNRNIY